MAALLAALAGLADIRRLCDLIEKLWASQEKANKLKIIEQASKLREQNKVAVSDEDYKKLIQDFNSFVNS